MRNDILKHLSNLVNAIEELIYAHENGRDTEEIINRIKTIIVWSRHG